MESTGVVIELEGGNALVEFERRSACGSCKGCGACSMSGNKTRIIALNTANAKVGDLVSVEMHRRAFFMAMALLYGLPLVVFLSALLITSALALPELTQGIASVAATALVFIAIKYADKNLNKQEHFIARIVNVVHNQTNEETKGDL